MLASARGGRPQRPRLLTGRARAGRWLGAARLHVPGFGHGACALDLRPGRGLSRSGEGTTLLPLIERRTGKPLVSVADRARSLEAGALPQPPNPAREQIDALLVERKPDLVTVEGWRAIDGHKLDRGRNEQRPRVKLASRDELLAAAAATAPRPAARL